MVLSGLGKLRPDRKRHPHTRGGSAVEVLVCVIEDRAAVTLSLWLPQVERQLAWAGSCGRVGCGSNAKRVLQNGNNRALISSRNTSVVPERRSRRQAWFSCVQLPLVQVVSNNAPQLFTSSRRSRLAQLRRLLALVAGVDGSLPAVFGRPR